MFSAVVSVITCQTTSQHGQLFNWVSRSLSDPGCSRGTDVSSACPFTLSFIFAAKSNCNAFIINSCVKLCQRLFQDISLLICSSDDFDLPIFPSKMLLSSLPDYCNLHGMLNSIKKRKENKESLSRTIACELCRILPCD